MKDERFEFLKVIFIEDIEGNINSIRNDGWYLIDKSECGIGLMCTFMKPKKAK